MSWIAKSVPCLIPGWAMTLCFIRDIACCHVVFSETRSPQCHTGSQALELLCAARTAAKMPKLRMQSHCNHSCQHTVMYLMRLCQSCQFSIMQRGQVDAQIGRESGGYVLCMVSLIGSALGFPQTAALTPAR